MKHREGYFFGADATKLYYQNWQPEGEVKAIVVLIHGLGAHSGIFDNVVKFLGDRNYAVYGFDLRGHGRSGEQRGYINNWREFREDLGVFLRLVKEQEPNLPLFIIAQSLGATIALDYVLHYRDQVQGLVTLSPALSVRLSPLKLALGRLLSQIYPRFSLHTGLDVAAGSRDPKKIAASIEDSLRHKRGTARLATEFFRAVAWVKSHISELQVPILILHGGADQVTPAEDSQWLFGAINSTDKELHIYPESYHELHNDLNYLEVLEDIEDWLARHLATISVATEPIVKGV